MYIYIYTQYTHNIMVALLYIGFSVLIMTTTLKCGLLWVCIITFWPCAMASWWFPSSYPWQNRMIIFEQKSWRRRAGPPWHMCTDNPFENRLFGFWSPGTRQKRRKNLQRRSVVRRGVRPPWGCVCLKWFAVVFPVKIDGFTMFHIFSFIYLYIPSGKLT